MSIYSFRLRGKKKRREQMLQKATQKKVSKVSSYRECESIYIAAMPNLFCAIAVLYHTYIHT